jgi:hypothetical protein
MMQQIPPKKKKVGEMGKPSNQEAFDKAMQKEWESRKQGAPGKTKEETKKEAEDREMGKKKVEQKQTINDPRKPRLMTAIDRAGVKLKKMY